LVEHPGAVCLGTSFARRRDPFKPEVDVQIARMRFPATAAEIGVGDPDYARLWKLVNDKNGNRYDEYQKKTTRSIPVVALTRVT
jgi:F420H(2)-dependent quinone reductase